MPPGEGDDQDHTAEAATLGEWESRRLIAQRAAYTLTSFIAAAALEDLVAGKVYPLAFVSHRLLQFQLPGWYRRRASRTEGSTARHVPQACRAISYGGDEDLN